MNLEMLFGYDSGEKAVIKKWFVENFVTLKKEALHSILIIVIKILKHILIKNHFYDERHCMKEKSFYKDKNWKGEKTV